MGFFDIFGPYKLLAMGIIAALAMGAAAAGGYKLAWHLQAGHISDLKLADATALNKAVAAAIAREHMQNAASNDAGKVAEVHQAAVAAHAEVIREEVPVYVTVKADATCVLPVGAFRLLDAAADGGSPDASLDAPGQSNDAPSGVDCSRFVAVVAEDFARYRQIAAQLNDILDLAARQAALAPAAPS
jgi:hypothetical protein